MPPYFRCYFPESCKEVVLFYKSHDLIPSGGGFFVVFCVAWLLTLWGFFGKNSTKWFVSPDGSACLHGLSLITGLASQSCREVPSLVVDIFPLWNYKPEIEYKAAAGIFSVP